MTTEQIKAMPTKEKVADVEAALYRLAVDHLHMPAISALLERYGWSEAKSAPFDDEDDYDRDVYTCECGNQIRTSGDLRDQGWAWDKDGLYICRSCAQGMATEFGATLGQRLRYLREAQEWTLEEVANAADISVSYLSQLEREEKVDPSARFVQRLAKQLRVSMEDLLGEEPRFVIEAEPPNENS